MGTKYSNWTTKSLSLKTEKPWFSTKQLWKISTNLSGFPKEKFMHESTLILKWRLLHGKDFYIDYLKKQGEQLN